jgi:hypothetical protein
MCVYEIEQILILLFILVLYFIARVLSRKYAIEQITFICKFIIIICGRLCQCSSIAALCEYLRRGENQVNLSMILFQNCHIALLTPFQKVE